MSNRPDGFAAKRAANAKKSTDDIAAEGVADFEARVEAVGGRTQVEGTMEPDQISIDPQMLQQMIMTKNARLIATMVHENAVLEVALEQERRNSGEWQAKYAALQAAFNA